MQQASCTHGKTTFTAGGENLWLGEHMKANAKRLYVCSPLVHHTTTHLAALSNWCTEWVPGRSLPKQVVT